MDSELTVSQKRIVALLTCKFMADYKQFGNEIESFFDKWCNTHIKDSLIIRAVWSSVLREMRESIK